MEQIVNQLLELFIYPYTGSVILMTYIILKYILKDATSNQKLLITMTSGIILAVVWIFAEMVNKSEYDKLIYSFLFANVSYKYIIKVVMNKLNIQYNDKKGIV